MNKESENMPDFKELEDRMIAQHSSEPTLIIKTNADSKNVTEQNPYYKGKDTDKFRSFFNK
ncbi:hypothetical protein P6P90_08870 [Ectobacillus antri]|jgi:hypothetical protein|uniref:Uncharacterized protein n=1 Tax=Ectobacillus antri TaxID=2486280 RepID=A0ABT6H5T6_9BACI|nr:hypothetical protein [Ectobacillus antri]MDG4656982.1 hypothetical protein [Ectobacillus antri]MDG5754084.1 hypothetical protein [Ectobacillus antri]